VFEKVSFVLFFGAFGFIYSLHLGRSLTLSAAHGAGMLIAAIGGTLLDMYLYGDSAKKPGRSQ